MMKTYIINLDGNPERLEKIGSILTGFGLPFERISAVDGRRYDLATLADYDAPAAMAYMGRSLVGGEIGCYYSHLKVAKAFLETDAPYALVFEDDALPLCNTVDLLDKALPDLDALDPDWLLINIGNNKMKISTGLGWYAADEKRFELVAAHYFPMTTSAIVWSRRGAERFVREHRTIFAPVDNFFRHWLTREGHGYSFWPTPVTTSGAESQILASSGASRKNNSRRWFYGFAKQKRLMIDKYIAWRKKRRFRPQGKAG
ncbi:UNVERIFIED_ORG: glycosyltransferase family 25 protein [Roseateles sp. XES5]|nr:glycosyltransferase family 25 protein [Roseateles sp. XES5]